MIVCPALCSVLTGAVSSTHTGNVDDDCLCRVLTDTVLKQVQIDRPSGRSGTDADREVVQRVVTAIVRCA